MRHFARFQLTRRVAWSLGNSWASCDNRKRLAIRKHDQNDICWVWFRYCTPCHKKFTHCFNTQLNSTENYGRRCLTPLSPQTPLNTLDMHEPILQFGQNVNDTVPKLLHRKNGLHAVTRDLFFFQTNYLTCNRWLAINSIEWRTENQHGNKN